MTAFNETWTILKKLSPSAQRMQDNAKLADLINWINTRKYANESQATQPAPSPYKPPAPPVSFSPPLFPSPQTAPPAQLAQPATRMETRFQTNLKDFEPLENAWDFLKALPEQQFFNRESMHPGTLHPAVLAMARRRQAKRPFGSVDIRRLQRPDDEIQERTGSPDFVPEAEKNVEDIRRYGATVTGHYDPKHPDYRTAPSYPPRDPIYFDTPLNLEGGY